MITVDVASVCGDEVRTSYSLIVKHILEEEINYDVVELSIENEADGYYYVIHEQYPTNGTGKMVYSVAILFGIQNDYCHYRSI